MAERFNALAVAALLAVASACGAEGAASDQTVAAGPPDGGMAATADGAATSTNDGAPPTIEGGPDVPSIGQGVLVGGSGPLPGAIAGIDYRSGALSGTTDASGTFRYETGASVTFSIAGVSLASVPGRPKLSPFALAGGPCSMSDALRRVLVTLETLDDDGNPETGIVVPPQAAPAGESRALATMDGPAFDAWLSGLSKGRPPANAAEAARRFVLRVEDEAWSATDEVAFDSVASASRSQGVAFDGNGYVFSWRFGLQRTNAALGTVVDKPAAIPFDLLVAGSNHIGDIDVHAGTLYAPIEDGSGYQHPRVVLFDAQTLTEKSARFELPTSLLTKGVPWIAIDGPANVAYVAEWDPTPSIFVFDLATFTHQRTIPLTATLGRIQGAKVLEGSLYAAADDANKTVYKIHLETGIVMPPLFSYGASVVKELEGLAVIPASANEPAQLRVLGVDAGGSSVTFRTHTRSRAPLRAELCAF